MRSEDDRATDLVNAHFERVERSRPRWAMHRAAYKNEFWKNNPWMRKDGFSLDAELPIKVEINQVLPFVSGHVANLFYRSPKTQVLPPAVFESRVGRPKKLAGMPDVVSAYLDDWLNRAGMRVISTYAFQLGLMYDSCAFKVGIRKGSRDVISRSWAQVLAPWEVLWDTDAGPEQQTHKGHLRWERIDVAKQTIKDDLTDVTPARLPDFLSEQARSKRQHTYEGYVRILELYDLVENKQQFYVITGDGANASAKQYGETLPCPFDEASGEPGTPLIPVVLANTPEKPFEGIAAVSRMYELNAETNLLTSIIANQMRRDANRIVTYLKNRGVDDKLIDAMMTGGDLSFHGVDTEKSLAELFHVIELPSMASALTQYRSWLELGRQDVQGSSDLQQGRQGKYLSATEAGLLAGYGEAASNDLQARMTEAMLTAGRTHLALLGATMTRPISVLIADEYHQLTKDIVELPWNISLTDAAATPVKDAAKKQELFTIMPMLTELAKLAAGSVDPEGPRLAPEVARFAQEALDYAVQLWRLPPTMSWKLLSALAEEEEGPDEEEVEQIRALIRKANVPEPSAAPPVAAVDPGLVPPGVP